MSKTNENEVWEVHQMKSARSFKEFEALNGISMEEVLTVFEAVSEAFPMIVAANLTKNTYTMIKDDGFLANDMPSSGKYDDLIDVGVENIHPNYQRAFLDNFSRERLLQMLGQGRKEVCIKLYQKGRGDHYQWVSTHVIRVKDKDGDVCHICINKVLDECSSCENSRESAVLRTEFIPCRSRSRCLFYCGSGKRKIRRWTGRS